MKALLSVLAALCLASSAPSQPSNPYPQYLTSKVSDDHELNDLIEYVCVHVPLVSTMKNAAEY